MITGVESSRYHECSRRYRIVTLVTFVKTQYQVSVPIYRIYKEEPRDGLAPKTKNPRQYAGGSLLIQLMLRALKW